MKNTKSTFIDRLLSLTKWQVTLSFYKWSLLLMIIQLLLEDFVPYNIIDWQWYAIPQILIFGWVIIRLENIIWWLVNIWYQIPVVVLTKWDDIDEIDAKLDNIPLEHLITFLLEKQAWKVAEVKEEFWLSTRQYQKLWDNMERVGILSRWENNARILSEITADMMIDILVGVEDSDNLKPLMIKRDPDWSSYSLSTNISVAE